MELVVSWWIPRSRLSGRGVAGWEKRGMCPSIKARDLSVPPGPPPGEGAGRAGSILTPPTESHERVQTSPLVLRKRNLRCGGRLRPGWEKRGICPSIKARDLSVPPGPPPGEGAGRAGSILTERQSVGGWATVQEKPLHPAGGAR
jgi:hypothetical protein